MSKEKNSKQMSLLEDSPANQCQSLEAKKEQVTTDISGQTCLDSLGKSNPNSLLGKMCKELLTSKTAWYSDRCKMTWKVKTSKSNVSLFQLQASVLGTKETEFGLLATPNTMDHLPPRSKEGTLKLQQGHRKGRTKPANLREQMDPETMKMYPTPAQFEDRTPPQTTHKMDKKNFQKKMSNLASRVRYQAMYPTPRAKEPGRTTVGYGRGLAELVEGKAQMWPTPQRSDHLANQSETLEAWKKRAAEKKKQGINLQFALRHAVQKEEKEKRMYPTPQADDSKNVNPAPKRRMTLAKHVKMYPTPTAQDHSRNTVPPSIGKTRGMDLSMRVVADEIKKQMYPTPTVGCEEGGEQSERVERTKSGAFILRKKNKPNNTFGAKLSDAMLYLEKNKMLPTPTVNDSKNNAGPSQYKRKGTNLNVAVGGKLNPAFVEFLMGFPMDWTKVELTESKASATQLSPK